VQTPIAIPTLAPPITDSVVNPGFEPEPSASALLPPASEVPASDTAPSSWPWWLAALALAGVAAFALLRQRRGERRLAPAGPAVPEPLPRATPEPPPVRALPPSPAPAPPPAPASGGIVAARLRPWIDFELVPERASLTEQGIVLHFELVVINPGNAPARDVRIEARMINAGASQEAELAQFFRRPLDSSDAVVQLPPLGRLSLRSSVVMPRERIEEFVVEGRRLFVPVVAFNALYRWSGGDGQGAAAFLVGRGKDTDAKLGPLRMDLGPRLFRDLVARRLEAGGGR
jgi:MYXO-CTERM domain-containing protein